MHIISPAVYTVIENRYWGEAAYGMGGRRNFGFGSCVRYAIAFAIGLMLSCFCPPGLILFIVAIILVWLGIVLLRKC
jgi:hypothetical protein